MEQYATIEKRIGETPLEAAERLRQGLGLPDNTPLAYAGRLDPMASGKLLILIGEECKRQSEYHALDKQYEFEVLFGVRSDTADVLGIVERCDAPQVSEADLRRATKHLVGKIELPYPHFSAKTVRGKPLHTWTLEGKLDEIEIPTRVSRVYKLKATNLRTISKEEVLRTVREKIESIAPVTDERKALGRDFRRDDVRASWTKIEKHGPKTFQIATLTCTCSSGTYMRSLAETIAKDLGTCGLAYSIHRSKIGIYQPVFKDIGFWRRSF